MDTQQLSSEAKTLLGYLNSHGGTDYATVAQWQGATNFYVVHSPDFNWDSRIDFRAQQVQVHAAVYELAELGYLQEGTCPMSALHADYCPNFADPVNRVFTLTEIGKRKGAELVTKSKAA